MDNQLDNSIVLNDGDNVTIVEETLAPVGQPAADIPGDNVQLTVNAGRTLVAPDAGNSALLSFGSDVEITNAGVISGALNGISSSGDGFALRNSGTISSDSRAVDLTDGDDSNVLNTGTILGTGNQRNGTLYVDGTVDDLSIDNQGLIDAGAGNLGDALSVQVGAADVISGNDNINITNSGSIAGRGDGPEVFANGSRVAANGSSGVRFFNGSGNPETAISGSLENTGSISAEVNVGFLGGVVVEDGVAFDGTITNGPDGSITGPRNGLYIGDAEHDLVIENAGSITSGSRAVNLDGDNVIFNNSGEVLGLGDQRNGTLYIDGTGDDITVNNLSGGVIDAGEGNSGSGVSVQVGTVGYPAIENIEIVNDGLIQGRGEGNVPAGVRLFVASGLEEASFTGGIINDTNGVIASESQAGVLIEENVEFNGQVINDGTITGGNGFAIDADGALGSVDVANSGILDGEVRLGAGDDSFVQAADEAVVVTGGLGNDEIAGGSGSDTVRFDDIDVPVTVTLDDNGDGTATLESGFAVRVSDVDVDSLAPDAIAEDAAFVAEALAGNLYFNIHTNDFTGGEIRGQLDTIVSDATAGGVRTIVLSALLDAAQEPGPTSDSEATGEGLVTLEVAADGSVSYSVDLETSGLATSDLLPVAIFSAIHLHNAPRGENGPVILDVIQDAGGDVFGVSQSPDADTGDGNVFSEIVETDILSSIENVVGSNDNDVILAGAGANQLEGNDGNDELAGGAGGDTLLGGLGDDTLRGGGGNDVTDGGDGIDTADFSDIGAAVTAALEADGNGTAEYQGPSGLIVDQLISIENLIGSANSDSLAGNDEANLLSGLAGADTLLGGGGDDTLIGGGGNDVTDGGAGSDTADFSNIGSAVTANIGAGGNGTAQYQGPPGVIVDQLISIENLVGSDNDDVLSGNVDANQLSGGEGADTLIGAGGSDSLLGAEGNDLLQGGVGNDSLNGGVSNDTLLGQGGADTLLGAGGLDTLIGASGSDLLQGGVGNDSLSGGGNDDTLLGQGGNDTLIGGSGFDSLVGGTGSDLLKGGLAADVLSGSGGNDTLLGQGGNDTLTGGSGLDSLVGGLGNDLLQGGIANDTLNGAGNNDFLEGKAGFDVLLGGSGNDILVGGLNNDTLTGGPGADTFRYSGGFSAIGQDLITDFASDDTLELSRSTFGLSGAIGANISSSDFEVVSSLGAAQNSNAEIVYNSNSGDLFFNANGAAAGFGAGGQFAELENNFNLGTNQIDLIA